MERSEGQAAKIISEQNLMVECFPFKEKVLVRFQVFATSRILSILKDIGQVIRLVKVILCKRIGY